MVGGVATTGEQASEQASEHLVVLYERDHYLIECLSAFVMGGRLAGDDVVVIATPAHRRALVDAIGPEADEDRPATLTLVDAETTLQGLLVDGHVDVERLAAIVEPVFLGAERNGRTVRIYGEMVALLMQRGDADEALALEAHWNRLARRHTFTLLCGYGAGVLDGHAHELPAICGVHTGFTTEWYEPVQTPSDWGMSTALLRGGRPGGHLT